MQGWKDYCATGAVCGHELPEGLEESQQLPTPIFTPATKAEVGDHDENIDVERAKEIVGDAGLVDELQRISIALYESGAAHAIPHAVRTGKRGSAPHRAGRAVEARAHPPGGRVQRLPAEPCQCRPQRRVLGLGQIRLQDGREDQVRLGG